jgi:hypothetical protein
MFGGQGANCEGVGDGGSGGVSSLPGEDGGDARDSLSTTQGGGGGGGVGRIRVNTSAGTFGAGTFAIVSPSPSVGTLAFRPAT